MPTKPLKTPALLDHLNNAAASGCTLVMYARNHELKASDLYVWKVQLIKLGHLPTSNKHVGRKFVPVVSAGNAASATLVMPNGFRLELQGGLDRALLQDLV